MFKVCVVEKVCGFVVCWFSFCFFCFFGERKDRGGAQNSLSGPPFLTESDSFSPKKSEKTYLTNRALHVTFLLLNRRARSQTLLLNTRENTRTKKRSRETLDCLRFKTVSSEVTARSPFKK